MKKTDLELRIKELEFELSNLKSDSIAAKQTLKALMESEERFQMLFNKAPLGYQSLDIDGKFIEVNQTWLDTLGYTREEVIGKWFGDFLSPDYQDGFRKRFPVFKAQGYIHSEFEMVHKNGNLLFIAFEGKIGHDLKGEFKQTHCILQDITKSKQIEEEQRKWNMQFAKLSFNAPGLIFQFSRRLDGTYYVPIASEGIKEIFGCSPEDVLEDFSPIAKVIYPDDFDRVVADIENSAKHLTLFTCDFRVQIEGKSIQWIHSKSIPEKLADGTITWYGFNSDITESKRIESDLIKAKEKAEESEIKLKQSDRVFNLTLDMFCIAGFDGYFKYLNPAWERTLGWSIDELLSKPWLDFVHPDDAENTENIKSVIVDGKEIYKFENRYISKDGSIKWLSWNSQPFPNENIMIGAARDITEAKRIANELLQAKNEAEESERKLLEAQELSHVGNWDYTIDTDTVTWSKELFNIFERSYDLPAPQYSEQRSFYTEESFALLDKCIQDEKPYEIELDIITSNGKAKQIISKASIRRNKQNKIIGLYGTAQDITAQKNIEKDLISAKEVAENANKLKTEFLHNMSHEIRTPLNGIMGFSEMLNKPGLSEEKRNNYSKIVKNSSQQLLRVIDDILEISTLETKQTKLYETEFCLNDFLMELYAIFSLKSEDRNVPIYLEKPLHDKEIQIISDKTKLNKILSNLIENAIKFTAQGFVEIGYSVENDLLKLYVKDKGIGISAENQQKIFERFSQEDTDIAGTYGGLGLGLSICKENAQLLGGDITLESKKGSGSTFIVTIPYKPVGKETTDNNKSTTKTPAKDKTKTILVAEDEEMNYMYIEALFEDELDFNFDLIHAKNGREALDICMENKNIDIVLMDIKMPVMNGNEATLKIKKELPQLPIIAQTAYSAESEKRDAMKHGYDDFMSKPLDKDKLFETINKYMSIK